VRTGSSPYSLSYTYDQVGNRLTRVKQGVTTTYSYDDNNKLTGLSGGQTATFGYDNNGNMTSISGTTFGAWTLVYDDADQLTSVSYPNATGTFTYNALGQRMRAQYGTWGCWAWSYDGDRAIEESCWYGTPRMRFLNSGGSYFDQLLHEWHWSTPSRYPLSDPTGSVTRLIDGSATVTDSYSFDAFGRPLSASASAPNWYRYGGEWGYKTDPSGLLQLGARYYWPETGRFIQQDPIGSGVNWYAYVGNRPVTWVDPEGLWGIGGGVSAVVEDSALFLGGASTLFGGAGLFSDKSGHRRWGGFAGFGSFSYGPLGFLRMMLTFPRPPWVTGEYVGAGLEVWCTNADKPSDLAGPFMQFSMHLGIPGLPGGFLSIGIMAAWDQKGHAVMAVGPFGMGFGIAASLYETYSYTW
jgi:RHS repeat-associated protein